MTALRRYAGVHVTPSYCYIAVVEDGVVLDGLPERVAIVGGLESPEQLRGFEQEVQARLGEVQASGWGILCPELSFKTSYSTFVARISAETIFRVEAVRRGTEVRLMNRPSVRSALGLPKKGPLDGHVGALLEPTGQYWSSGRGLAAVAALALAKLDREDSHGS